jgi:hypothetical protein
VCPAYRREFGFNAISLYGLGDNFDMQTSHVLPALIRKFDEAKRLNDKSVEILGTGTRVGISFTSMIGLKRYCISCRTTTRSLPLRWAGAKT